MTPDLWEAHRATLTAEMTDFTEALIEYARDQRDPLTSLEVTRLVKEQTNRIISICSTMRQS